MKSVADSSTSTPEFHSPREQDFVSYSTNPEPPAASSITGVQYDALADAYLWFNRELFGAQLPDCLITLNRARNARGYFAPDRFQHRTHETACDEIALNPDEFNTRTPLDILSVLVHEMTHQWQAHFGKPSRSGYHNAEWANRMEGLGLMPSATGQPKGKRTGQAMTHFVIEHGRFDTSARAFLKQIDNHVIHWQSSASRSRSPACRSKTSYVCPTCSSQVWGKPALKLVCGSCSVAMPDTAALAFGVPTHG